MHLGLFCLVWLCGASYQVMGEEECNDWPNYTFELPDDSVHTCNDLFDPKIQRLCDPECGRNNRIPEICCHTCKQFDSSRDDYNCPLQNCHKQCNFCKEYHYKCPETCDSEFMGCCDMEFMDPYTNETTTCQNYMEKNGECMCAHSQIKQFCCLSCKDVTAACCDKEIIIYNDVPYTCKDIMKLEGGDCQCKRPEVKALCCKTCENMDEKKCDCVDVDEKFCQRMINEHKLKVCPPHNKPFLEHCCASCRDLAKKAEGVGPDNKPGMGNPHGKPPGEKPGMGNPHDKDDTNDSEPPNKEPECEDKVSEDSPHVHRTTYPDDTTKTQTFTSCEEIAAEHLCSKLDPDRCCLTCGEGMRNPHGKPPGEKPGNMGKGHGKDTKGDNEENDGPSDGPPPGKGNMGMGHGNDDSDDDDEGDEEDVGPHDGKGKDKSPKPDKPPREPKEKPLKEKKEKPTRAPKPVRTPKPPKEKKEKPPKEPKAPKEEKPPRLPKEKKEKPPKEPKEDPEQKSCRNNNEVTFLVQHHELSLSCENCTCFKLRGQDPELKYKACCRPHSHIREICCKMCNRISCNRNAT